jgi:lipid A oxidase
MRQGVIGLLVGGLLLGPGGARAETTLTFYLGLSLTHDSDVRVRLRDGTDLKYRGISWASRSFQLPFYYGLQLTHHFEPRRDWGVRLDFFHDKAYADAEMPVPVTGTRAGGRVEATEPLSTTVQGFNMSHGTNYLTLNVLRRWNTCPEPGCTGKLQPYVGAGAGLMIPHVEATVGEASVGEYQLTGPAFQLLGGLAWPFASRLSLMGEYRVTRGAAGVSIPGGTLDTTLYTHHFVAGPSLRLPLLP